MTDISNNWYGQTCTYSNHGPGEWQSVSLNDEHEITKIRVVGRSDEKQERNVGNKIYAIDASGEKQVECGEWPKGEDYYGKWIEFNCEKGTKAKTIKVEKPDKGILTLCGVEVVGYKNKKKTEEQEKYTSSLQNTAKIWEISKEERVEVEEKSSTVKKITDNIDYEDTFTTVDISTEYGWKKWSEALKAKKINLKPNSGFLETPFKVKTNSFIELIGKVDKDKGYEWFW